MLFKQANQKSTCHRFFDMLLFYCAEDKKEEAEIFSATSCCLPSSLQALLLVLLEVHEPAQG